LTPAELNRWEDGQVSRYARHGWIQKDVRPNGRLVRNLGSIGLVRTPPAEASGGGGEWAPPGAGA
jgi:hypothetical protein